MYKEPQVVIPTNPKLRAFVQVYILGKRHRFYNGNAFNIICFPNRCKSDAEKKRLLNHLHFTIKKSLENGWRPYQQTIEPLKVIPDITVVEGMNLILSELLVQPFSDTYKRDLRVVCSMFQKYLAAQGKEKLPMKQLKAADIEQFLKPFSRNGTYFMNKRRTLAAVLSRISRRNYINNPLADVPKLRVTTDRNKAFLDDEFKEVLTAIKADNQRLYLAVILMYGCFLRPHREIRGLKRSDFNSDITRITLSGNRNKSRTVRSVLVPVYVREELSKMGFQDLALDHNIFTQNIDTFAEGYFNQLWADFKIKHFEDGYLSPEHTLYSFRHTAAIHLYRKTKDAHLVQQAMGHSSLTTTLLYLKNLGMVNNLSEKDLLDLPIKNVS